MSIINLNTPVTRSPLTPTVRRIVDAILHRLELAGAVLPDVAALPVMIMHRSVSPLAYR
jgi:hypothetical protein